MKKQSRWENFYNKTLLDKIPWQTAQDDYLREIINSDQVRPGSALDLGCGTGIKSIFLAEKGFKVTGVDISQTAIGYAKENARKAEIKIELIVADATDLSFLGDRKFDLIVDWANLHGIVEDKREKYISEIVKHTKEDSRLLLRCFGRKEKEERFTERSMGRIHLFLKEDIKELYGKDFRILMTNTSKASDNAPGKFFHEFLMERRR